MLNAGNSNDSLTLYQAAQGYRSLGFSVIPVHIDPGRAKVAAVAWKPYQQRLATDAELRTWFLEQGHPGIAIVTGAASNLIVLDFDDRHLYERFCFAYPDLRQTYTVRTRRGHHLYYRMPDHTTVRSRKGQGIDLQADGSYVVAPPTTIEGHSYQIKLAVPLRTITPHEITALESFFAWASPDTPAATEKREFGAFSCEIEGIGKDYLQPQRQLLTIHDLQYLYSHLAQKGSRNEALFRVSLKARDEGWDREQVVAALLDVHTHQPAAREHGKESLRQRHSEAVKTIQSAFSRPPGRFTSSKPANPQIPNSVREKLLQMQQTYTVRVLDGLRLAGIQPGQVFTTRQALKLLKGRVGRDSVYHALNATTNEGDSLLEQANPPLDTPKSKRYADNGLSTGQPKNAFLVGEKYQEKIERGRPERVFVMPTNLDLCRKLKVKLTWSDPLSTDDLATAKQTRMAVHREFIRRRPGVYPRRWLAHRLGVCTVTLDTYNREIPINVRHCFSEKPITWRNLHELPLSLDIAGTFLEDEKGKRYPAKREIAGTFLEDEKGKRYPAKREIARKLLARKHTLTYKCQDANFYWFGDLPLQLPYARLTQPIPAAPQSIHRRNGYTSFSSSAAESRNCKGHEDGAVLAAPSVQPMPLPLSEPLIVRDDTAAQNRLAERVYKTVQQLSSDPSQHMSKANAQRLVETYGVAVVEKALKRMTWLVGKGRAIERPAGFLITTSRLEWREQENATEIGAPAPRFGGMRISEPTAQK